jgi:hypothetical protein
MKRKPYFHFVYFLASPGSDLIFYVGRSLEPERRLAVFVLEKNLEAVIHHTLRFSTLADAQNAELRAIQSLRPIYNKVLVSSPGHLGFKHTKETKLKLSKDHLGVQTFLGRKHSEETKEKLRLINLGKVVSEETREKLRAKVITTAMRENMRKGQLGRKPPQEVKDKIGKSHLGMKHTQASKDKISAAYYKRSTEQA